MLNRIHNIYVVPIMRKWFRATKKSTDSFNATEAHTGETISMDINKAPENGSASSVIYAGRVLNGIIIEGHII